MEKICPILGPCSCYQSASLSQLLLRWRSLTEIQISLPLFPEDPLTIQVRAQKPPILWSNLNNSCLSCWADYPPTTTCSRVWPQWLGKNDSFSSLSFLQAFLSPWAEHCVPWWDKQKWCVFISHKGMANRGTWSGHTWQCIRHGTWGFYWQWKNIHIL